MVTFSQQGVAQQGVGQHGWKRELAEHALFSSAHLLISLRDSRRGNSRLRGTEASRPRGFEAFQTYEKMPVIQTFIRKASDGIMLDLND